MRKIYSSKKKLISLVVTELNVQRKEKKLDKKTLKWMKKLTAKVFPFI